LVEIKCHFTCMFFKKLESKQFDLFGSIYEWSSCTVHFLMDKFSPLV
jgi:hypothetical protein